MLKIYKNLLLCLSLSSCVQAINTEKTQKTKNDTTPNPNVVYGEDPLFKYQWHLNKNSAGFIYGQGHAETDINLGDLHEYGHTGKNINIVVSDQEVQLTHEDLNRFKKYEISRNYASGNSSSGTNGVNPFTSSSKASHGTAVAGVIAANMYNSLGGRGVAPEANIGNYNFISHGTMSGYSETLASQATARSVNAVDIFNYSWGAYTCTLSLPSPIFQNNIKNGSNLYRNNLGSIYVKAAGNEYLDDKSSCYDNHGTTPSYYLGNANFEGDNVTPYIILVGATAPSGNSANYSTPGANLWISAPGGELTSNLSTPGILTTDVTGCSSDQGYSKSSSSNSFEKGQHSLNSNCKYTANIQGTSFSAPIITGVSALLLQANPQLSWRDVKYILAKTATAPKNYAQPTHPYEHSNTTLVTPTERIAFMAKVPADYVYDHGKFENPNGFTFHNWYGFGLVDANAAVEFATNNYSSPFYNKNFTELQKSLNADTTCSVIPDGNATGCTKSVSVIESFNIEAVEIQITTSNSKASDIGIELIFTPYNTAQEFKTTLVNANSFLLSENYISTKLISNAYYMMNAQGTWKVKVIDAFENQVSGSITNLNIKFYGHY